MNMINNHKYTQTIQARVCPNVNNGKRKINSYDKMFMSQSDITECVKSIKVKNCEGYNCIPQRILVDGLVILDLIIIGYKLTTNLSIYLQEYIQYPVDYTYNKVYFYIQNFTKNMFFYFRLEKRLELSRLDVAPLPMIILSSLKLWLALSRLEKISLAR